MHETKEGRSALTILGIFIGIAAVMTIVSVLEGMKEFTRQQYAAMGSNRISVNIWSNSYDDVNPNAAPTVPAASVPFPVQARHLDVQ